MEQGKDEKMNKKRANFTGTIGFVMAAAGSAVGLGNIWRVPYLAAKDHGGVFILCYLILAVTFGFTLLTTEIAIGRKTGRSPLTAYAAIQPKWKGLGVLACLVPIIILPYYLSPVQDQRQRATIILWDLFKDNINRSSGCLFSL